MDEKIRHGKSEKGSTSTPTTQYYKRKMSTPSLVNNKNSEKKLHLYKLPITPIMKCAEQIISEILQTRILKSTEMKTAHRIVRKRVLEKERSQNKMDTVKLA